MRTGLTAALSTCLLVVAGCTATGEGSTAKPFQLVDGTYQATFPSSGCGTMVISGGGSSINYAFGPCGGSRNFRSQGRFDGKVIRIASALYMLSNVTDHSMTGRWLLRGRSQRVIFEKT